ncbi:MAG TPA: hypothetical protein DDY68_06200 [Porphyromonadaceae bacterium]|nr:hypothetical protein [Porphyromonadaceae bacterium]
MKKVILALVAVAMVATASAQEKKMWIGGTLGIGMAQNKSMGVVGGKENKLDKFNMVIAPEFGYRLNEKWAVGAQLIYGLGSYKGDALKFQKGVEGDKLNTYSLGIAPFVRWNLVSLANGKFTFFFDGSLYYKHNKKAMEGVYDGIVAFLDGIDPIHTNEWGVGIRPGFMFSPTPSFSLIAKIGFLGFKSENICNKEAHAYSYDSNSSWWGLDFSTENLAIGALFNF